MTGTLERDSSSWRSKGKAYPAIDRKDWTSSHRFVKFSSQTLQNSGMLQCLRARSTTAWLNSAPAKLRAGMLWLWGRDLTGRVTETWCVPIHGCKQQSGEGLLVQLHRPHPSCTEKVLGLLHDFGIFSEMCWYQDTAALGIVLLIPTSSKISPLVKLNCCCHN